MEKQPEEGPSEEGSELPVPAAVLDGQGRVRSLSPSLSALIDDPEELVGKPLELVLAVLDERLPGSRASVLELAGGDRVALFGAPHAGVHELRRQVVHLSRLSSVGQLVSSVVHEINNALSGIIGYAQLALQRSNDESKDDLQRVHDEALRTSRVVQGLLRFGRSASRGKARCSLSETLSRCVQLKRRDLQLQSVSAELVLPGSLPAVVADEALLFQVFLNLISNAEQALAQTGRGGTIVIRGRRKGDLVQVDVRDDGPGVPAELRDRIFEPFFSSKTPDAHQGSGLGLPLCRDILRDHDGSIELVRTRRGGACFRVSLPLPAVEGDRARSARPRRLPIVARRHIAVVEDESSIRELVSRAFSGHGNRLVSFEHGEDALRYLQGEAVDLVISDIHRPGMNGIDLYHSLVKIRPEFRRRFLFLTGDVLSEEIQRFLEDVESLRKPVLLDQLLYAASRVLRRRQQQGELFNQTGAG